jgi:hypothetical protein
MDNELPIVVFGLVEGNIVRAVSGAKIGTLVSRDDGPVAQ